MDNVDEPPGPEPPEPDLRVEPDPVVVEEEDVEYVAAPSKRGRPKKLQTREQIAQVLKLYFVEKLSMRKVASVLGVSHMSVYRMLSDPNLELLI